MTKRCKYLVAIGLILSITTACVHADQDKNSKSNSPFEMVIFNIGRGHFEQPKITSGKFVGAPSLYDRNKINSLGVEVPFYKEYTALGFQFDMINGHKMGGADLLLAAKFRLPMHFRFGDIALTNTYRAGATSLFYNTNNEDEHEYAQFGITGITSIGIDYFPIRWLGVYCEYSWTITDILLNKQDVLNSNWQKVGTFNNRYAYTTKGLSLGIKFTF